MGPDAPADAPARSQRALRHLTLGGSPCFKTWEGNVHDE